MRRLGIAGLVALVILVTLGTFLSGCNLISTVREATPKASPKPPATPVPTPGTTAGPTPGGGGGTPSLTKYQHASGLFEISYPTGWQIEQDEVSVSFTSPDLKVRVHVNFSDLQTPLDENALKTFVDSFFTEEGISTMPNFSREEAATQGDGSVLVRFKFQNQDKTATGGSFFQYQGTVIYVLTFIVADENDWDAFIPTLNAVANSFSPKSPGGGTEGWSTLASEVGGYALDYPPDWEGAESEGAAYIKKDDETFLYIEVTSTLPVADPDQAERILTENVIAAIRRDDPNAKVTEPDTIMIGGEQGIYADFVYIDPATNLENMATAINVVHNGRAYQFVLFSLTTDSDVNMPLFTGMLTSFRFTH